MGPVPVPEALRICGLVLMAAGTAVFIAAFRTLKDSWRAGIDEGQKTELVTDGVYRVSRNPAFLGFDLPYCIWEVLWRWGARCCLRRRARWPS